MKKEQRNTRVRVYRNSKLLSFMQDILIFSHCFSHYSYHFSCNVTAGSITHFDLMVELHLI